MLAARLDGRHDGAVQLETDRDDVTLRLLSPADAEAYVALLRGNAAHLTRFGDYTEQLETPAAVYAERFGAQHPPIEFGICLDDILVGSVALVPVDPPRFGLGYWLAESACGRGVATTAVRAIVAYAERDLGATDVYAGVTHGNDKSAAVLRRAGFDAIAEFETYTRYYRTLSGCTQS